MVLILEKTKSNEAANPKITQDLLEPLDKSKNTPLGVEKYRLWFSKRFLVLILLFLGYFFTVGVKLCINIVIIEMTANKTIAVGNETIHKPPEYDWDSKTIGLVQGSFNYGFVFATVGGYLATKFGGSVTYGVTAAAESVLTIINPFCMEWAGFYGFLACRTATGLFDGLAYASTAEVFSRWIPATERSTFMAIIFCGVYIAAAVSYPLFGYVAYFFGWEMIFYVAGGSTLIWSIIWLIVVRNEPSTDKLISKKERLYIVNNAETTPRNQIVHPYGKILTSATVWALGVGKFTYGCGFFMIMSSLPLYVKDVTHKEVNEIGVISSIPNFACIFMTPVAGAIIDYLQNNTNLKPNQIHKILMTFGFVTSSICFFVVAFSNNFTLSMTCFVIIKLCLSFNFLIIQLVCLYMAPKHSSALLGLCALWSVISLTVVPCTIGFIVVNHSLEEWNKCYLVNAGVMMFGAVVYLFYGSSELQPWAM